MFASKSLAGHVSRGALGLGALAAAAHFADRGWPPLLLLPIALLALRGCPLCWTIGLIETLWARPRGRAVDASCVDGSCARRSEEA
jgi:hypothetical protein